MTLNESRRGPRTPFILPLSFLPTSFTDSWVDAIDSRPILCCTLIAFLKTPRIAVNSIPSTAKHTSHTLRSRRLGTPPFRSRIKGATYICPAVFKAEAKVQDSVRATVEATPPVDAIYANRRYATAPSEEYLEGAPPGY